MVVTYPGCVAKGAVSRETRGSYCYGIGSVRTGTDVITLQNLINLRRGTLVLMCPGYFLQPHRRSSCFT